MFGCAGQPDESQEIIDNLIEAGFPADDLQVVDGKVYAGWDAEVSLAASRELLRAGDTTEEQYRTTNLVSTSLSKVCINGSTFTGVFSTALDLAIQNFDELPLTFAMARTPSTGCSFTINAVIDPNMNGGVAGFPANGYPYGQITIGGLLSQYGVDTIEHVITHELGHTIGFRHTDYYNRAISCGSGGNEGDAGIGAIHIPATPTTATVGGSVMNSCFRSVETGEFTTGDLTAMRMLYTPVQGGWRWCNKCQGLFYGGIAGSVCPAGGGHDGSTSGNYHLAHSLAPTPGWQGGWRWCNKCQGLFYGGIAGSVCPAGGGHDGSTSGDYHLHHGAGSAPDLQSSWWWCHKCQGLFHAGIATPRCPAGGAHENIGAGDYSLMYR